MDFDHDMKEDVIQITQDRKKINIYHKSTSFHKVAWSPTILVDIKEINMPGGQSLGEVDQKISSFVIDDLNNDELLDIIIGVDIIYEDGSEKSTIIKAIQTQKFQFIYDKIEPDTGTKFIIIDVIPFEQKDYKDLLIMTKTNKLALIKNFDPNWVYVEISPTIITDQIYKAFEKLSGPPFHIYILDFDKDGYLDIALPNQLNNTIVYLRNPGSAYWRKVGQVVYQQGANRAKLASELKMLEKWK